MLSPGTLPGVNIKIPYNQTITAIQNPRDGSFAELDTAYGFALVYGESFVGGTDTATNSDPSKNILVGFHLQ